MINRLKQHPIFKALPDAELEQLLQQSRTLSLNKKDQLFRQGDEAKHFYFVVSGRMRLSRISEKGFEKVIEIITPGNTFAEALMFMQKQFFPVNAVALDKTELLAIPAQPFVSLLRDNPDACLRMLGNLSMKLHSRIKEIELLSQQDTTHRVAHFLLDQLGESASGRQQITLTLPKWVIASKLAMFPETFSRTLTKLSEHQLIEIQGKTITIPDVEQLQQALH